MKSKNRICIITENVSEPMDEGIKKFIYNVCNEIKTRRNCIVIGRNISECLGESFKSNRFYLDYRFIRKIRAFSPDTIIYIPESSLTLTSFIRSNIISFVKRPVAVVGLQQREYTFWQLGAIRHLKPDLLFVQSRKSFNYFTTQGFKVSFIHSGVDFGRFSPVGRDIKNSLRERYNIPLEKKILLHVGHLKNGRNLEDLALLKSEILQPLIVVSTSTEMDVYLRRVLEDRGITFYCEYAENIEHFYQMADAYIFPTIKLNSAIEFPLSVLEAMACGLPVLSTPFGGLKDFFKESETFSFYDQIDEARKKLESLLNANGGNNHRGGVIEKFSWRNVVSIILEEIEKLHVR